jgi:hypothetical protein
MLSTSTQQLVCEVLRSQSYTTVFSFLFCQQPVDGHFGWLKHVAECMINNKIVVCELHILYF